MTVEQARSVIELDLRKADHGAIHEEADRVLLSELAKRDKALARSSKVEEAARELRRAQERDHDEHRMMTSNFWHKFDELCSTLGGE